MDMPPSRLRVVERGRRLEVIDTGADGGARRVTRSAPPREPGGRPGGGWLPKQVRFDGTKRWTTHPFYDAKGPRTVTIAPGSAVVNGWTGVGLAIAALALAAVLAIAPWALLALGFAAFNPKARGQLRAAATRAIDRIEREGA